MLYLRTICLAGLSLLWAAGSFAQPGGGGVFPPPSAEGGEARMYELSVPALDRTLSNLHRSLPDFSERLRALARKSLGTPYCTDPLTRETLNWLPHQETNCTLFVLSVTAFANSRTYAEALEHMRFLHYRRGAVGFENRYHFTADRITAPENPYFEAVTEAYAQDPAALKRITLTLNRGRAGRPFFSGRLGGWSRTVTLSYLARSGFKADRLKALPAVIGVAFLKKPNWDKGILVGHEGLLVDGALYHASPESGVCEIRNYLTAAFPDSGWEGLVLFKINEVPLPCDRRPR